MISNELTIIVGDSLVAQNSSLLDPTFPFQLPDKEGSLNYILEVGHYYDIYIMSKEVWLRLPKHAQTFSLERGKRKRRNHIELMSPNCILLLTWN